MKKSYLMLLLVAMFALVACDNNSKEKDNSYKSEYDLAVENLMAQCKNFETMNLTDVLIGEWKWNSKLIYNDTWSNIIRAHYFMGEDLMEGGAKETYSFSMGGNGSLSSIDETIGPNVTPNTYLFDWQYDATNRMLVLSGELNRQFKVSGFNSEYIVLDYVNSTNQNIREILKKKVE